MVILSVKYVLSTSYLEFITDLPTRQPLSLVASIRNLDLDICLSRNLFLLFNLRLFRNIFIGIAFAVEAILFSTLLTLKMLFPAFVRNIARRAFEISKFVNLL